MKKTALIGMSGGVDSSVAAWLTLQQGFSCCGFTLKLHDFGCGGTDDAMDARAVADRLGIGHEILDAKDAFAEK